MPNFERSSLNQKLTIMSLLSTATALLFVFAAFAATSVANHRKDEAMQLRTFAQVIAASSADYLLLRDRARARSALGALAAKSDIANAVLYDRNGKPFAQYVAASDGAAEAIPAPEVLKGVDADALAAANAQGQHPLSLRMRLYQPVMTGELQVGVVMIETDLIATWIDILVGLAVTELRLTGIAWLAWRRS